MDTCGQRQTDTIDTLESFYFFWFPERESPISPLTVPSELFEFDQHKLALRVLTSEFRHKKAMAHLPSINVCDMQQLLEEGGLYIYCHYLPVADLGARSYTRAPCMTNNTSSRCSRHS